MNKWYETDSDCCQHMRHNGNEYEMIQAVWLDTTEADRKNGAHEYLVVAGKIDINDYSDDDILGAIGSYGYTMESLTEQYGDSAIDLIAECILEEEILNEQGIVAEFNTFEECEEFIKRYVKEN